MILPAPERVYMGLKSRIDHGNDRVQHDINLRAPIALRFSETIDPPPGSNWWVWITCSYSGIGYAEDLLEYLVKHLGTFPQSELLDKTTITTSWSKDVATGLFYPSCFVSFSGADSAVRMLVRDILIKFVLEERRR